ncbi:MAG TPA: ECF-type sigma factor, partial [Rudaea sp.]
DDVAGSGSVVDLVALDCALERLGQIDPTAARVIEWRIFAGLEMSEIGELQGTTERTVFRHWRRARAFLVNELDLAPPGIDS